MSVEQLGKLDVLYRRPIATLRQDEVPSIGEATAQKIRAKAEFVYAISNDQPVRENNVPHHKTSCSVM